MNSEGVRQCETWRTRDPRGLQLIPALKRDRRQGQPQMVTCPFSELEELMRRPDLPFITLLRPAFSLVLVLAVIQELFPSSARVW